MADIICEEPLSTLTNPGKADYDKKKLKKLKIKSRESRL